MRFLQTYRPLIHIGCLLLELILLAHIWLCGNDFVSWVFLGFAAAVLMAVVWFCFGIRRMLLHMGLMLICFCGQVWRENPLTGLQFAKPAVYRGKIVRTDFRAEGKMDLIVDLNERLTPLQQNITGRIRISITERCLINNDSLIQFSGKIYRSKSFDNVGVYNHRLNMRIKNIWGSVYLASCEEIHIVDSANASLIDVMRLRILDDLLLNKNSSEEQMFSRSVFAALLLGTATLDEDVMKSAQLAGISHLFAISGSHFAVMSLIVFAVVSFVMSFAPRVFLRIPRQKAAALVTMAFVVLFLVLAEYRPSILRSGCMILVYLTARLCHRRSFDVYIVLCSAVILLLYNPLQIFEVSFQLTYICVLYLILVYPVFESLIRIKTGKILINMTLLSMTIQVFLLPYVIYQFGVVSLGGFLNNVWAVPLFEFVVTPFSFAYLFVSLLALPIEQHLLQLWDCCWMQFSVVLQGVNDAIGYSVSVFPPSAKTLLVFYVGVFVLLYFKSRRGLVLCGCTVVLLIAMTWYHHRHAYDVRITQFDVDQGDSTLIQTTDQNVLVDTGGHAYFDIGGSVVYPALKHLWVSHLDLVVLTHPDLDHYQGLLGLLERVSVGEIWIAPVQSDEKSYLDLLQRIDELKIPRRMVMKDERRSFAEKTQLRIISPSVAANHHVNKNDSSLVVLIENEHMQFLITGDAPKSIERNFFKELNPKKLNILKVGHHGSDTSTGDLLLQHFKPQFALIGVGEQSRFGHPNRRVLQRLDLVGARVLRTDLHGMIQLQINEDHIEYETYYP